MEFFIYEDILDSEENIEIGKIYNVQGYIVKPVEKTFDEIYAIEIIEFGIKPIELYTKIFKFTNNDLIEKFDRFCIGFSYIDICCDDLIPILISKDYKKLKEQVDERREDMSQSRI